jgi:hypothetical protein
MILLPKDVIFNREQDFNSVDCEVSGTRVFPHPTERYFNSILYGTHVEPWMRQMAIEIQKEGCNYHYKNLNTLIFILNRDFTKVKTVMIVQRPISISKVPKLEL